MDVVIELSRWLIKSYLLNSWFVINLILSYLYQKKINKTYIITWHNYVWIKQYALGINPYYIISNEETFLQAFFGNSEAFPSEAFASESLENL